MDKEQIFRRLQQLTGSLQPTGEPSDLAQLQKRLALAMAAHPDIDITGTQSPHEAAISPTPIDLNKRFDHLVDLLDKQTLTGTERGAPLIFRRETAFSNNLLGNSVPSWGSGMAPTDTYGPFINEYGILQWFDFFVPTRMVKVMLQGQASPVLLLPIKGILTARTAFSIEAGSVWIASNLIARTSALNGFYTGLTISGGQLNFSAKALINGDAIVLPTLSNATLQLDLKQKTVTNPSADAGFDATAALIQLPKNCSLSFSVLGSSITAGDASCTVFGNSTQFSFANKTPQWIDFLHHILIPYNCSSIGNTPAAFVIADSASKLNNFAGSAKIGNNSGWLLPAAQVSAAQLGNAAGTGALCIGLEKGLSAQWKGLKGGSTKLLAPAIIAEPGMVSVIDFFAENTSAKQQWVLWQNSGAKHHSSITLGFGKGFPFVFVSASSGTEQLLFFCNYKAALDKPVDANGDPFPVQSTIALGAIMQNGKDYKVMLLDTDLLYDGNPQSQQLFKKYSIALRNALFITSPAYSLFLTGELLDDNTVIKGSLALMFGIRLYLPTLPDPYVSSFTAFLGRGAGQQQTGLTQMALGAFVKWPNPAVADPAQPANDPGYLYFRFAPLQLPPPPKPTPGVILPGTFNNNRLAITGRNFQTGISAYNQRITLHINAANAGTLVNPEVKMDINGGVGKKLAVPGRTNLQDPGVRTTLEDLKKNPALAHITNRDEYLRMFVGTVVSQTGHFRSPLQAFAGAAEDNNAAERATATRFSFADRFMLLDVSSNADQMGVSFGAAIRVERNQRGDVVLGRPEHTVDSMLAGRAAAVPEMPLQIDNMDVVSTATNLRAVTLPQISWEPVVNVPLKLEGNALPADDLITYTPGLVVYENDGLPTRIFSESPYQVPITPLSVTKHFIREYNDKQLPRNLHSIFTLPFAMVAQAHFRKDLQLPADRSAQLHLHMPQFNQLRGGLQIKTVAPKADSPQQSNTFEGQTVQIDNNIRWFLLGYPLTGSTLGNTVKTIFNGVFNLQKPAVPLEKMEISGYGASIFSNWRNEGATIADVSQAKFDVIVGRTAHEVVQVRSVMYMCTGIVHVVRTITLMRSPSGYVFRSDSGWKAESDAFYNCDYKIDFSEGGVADIVTVTNPYEFHKGAVKGVSAVREIKDYPAAGKFTGSFSLNESGLPTKTGKPLAKWKAHVFANINSLDDQLPVILQAVVFDGDVHMDNLSSGAVKDPVTGDFITQTRKMMGYVQLSPTGILITPRIFAELLQSQNGSLGGPIDSIINIAGSDQKMRLSRVDINPALNGAGQPVFATAARGSLLLPKDGSWSTVKQHTDTGDVQPVEEGQTVPLIKTNGAPNFKIANPADVLLATASKINFGVLQSTGTQKLLFDTPQFASGVKKLISAQTYFADAYKLLNSKGVFPNIANALQLTNAEKEVAIIGEGLMKMAERTLDMNSLLSNFQYPFINEPGVLKIYAEYKSKNGSGNLKLGIDSAGAATDKWKAALSNIRIVVDLGPFTELMWINGNFDAGSSVQPNYNKPNLELADWLQKVKEILKILKELSGGSFDDGMEVSMSNSPDNWEYKLSCSQEIPVIKFPSPVQLSVNPNPPLKLEAGLKVGFYFNEKLAIPTDLKQLVPACGAFLEFYGKLQVQCFSLGVASIYAVGQVNLGIAADTKAGITLYMKFGFGVELVVGLPVVANVSVLYMVEIEVSINEDKIRVAALMMFRGHAEICGGLVGITIQIEAGGAIETGGGNTSCVAQVTFSIDVCVLWVIDIDFTDSWEETRQIA
ncbi:MAG TPA: hypothetical protein VL307_04475 [Chitinophagaceae bacterium]|nr:hypothetical protein [Chitinophagaceae bacterium]